MLSLLLVIAFVRLIHVNSSIEGGGGGGGIRWTPMCFNILIANHLMALRVFTWSNVCQVSCYIL